MTRPAQVRGLTSQAQSWISGYGKTYQCSTCKRTVQPDAVEFKEQEGPEGSVVWAATCGARDSRGSKSCPGHITIMTPHYNYPGGSQLTSMYPPYFGNFREAGGGGFNVLMYREFFRQMAADLYNAFVAGPGYVPAHCVCDRLERDELVSRFFVDYDGKSELPDGGLEEAKRAATEEIRVVVEAFTYVLRERYPAADESILKVVVCRNPLQLKGGRAVKFGAHLIWPNLHMQTRDVAPHIVACARARLCKLHSANDWSGIDTAPYAHPNLRCLGAPKSNTCGECKQIGMAYRFANQIRRAKASDPEAYRRIIQRNKWTGYPTDDGAIQDYVRVHVNPLKGLSEREIESRQRSCSVCGGRGKVLMNSFYVIDSVYEYRHGEQALSQSDMGACYTSAYNRDIDRSAKDLEQTFIERWVRAFEMATIRVLASAPEATPGFVRDERVVDPKAPTSFDDPANPTLSFLQRLTMPTASTPQVPGKFVLYANRVDILRMASAFLQRPVQIPFAFRTDSLVEQNYASFRRPDWPDGADGHEQFWNTFKRVAVLQAATETWRQQNEYEHIVIKNVKMAGSVNRSIRLLVEVDPHCIHASFCPNMGRSHTSSTSYMIMSSHPSTRKWSFKICCHCTKDNAAEAVVRVNNEKLNCRDFKRQQPAQPVPVNCCRVLNAFIADVAGADSATASASASSAAAASSAASAASSYSTAAAASSSSAASSKASSSNTRRRPRVKKVSLQNRFDGKGKKRVDRDERGESTKSKKKKAKREHKVDPEEDSDDYVHVK